MSAEIRELAEQRGITRLCHFTQSRNLPHILDAGRILSSTDLKALGLPTNLNDTERLDGLEDHISCTVEYPNTWYMAKAASRERLFEDWIVLELEPRYLWRKGTRFSPVNAAKGRGSFVTTGLPGFEGLFDVSPSGSRQARGLLHLPACPTDNQAEVLVGIPIPAGDILSVTVRTSEQASIERERLRRLGHTQEIISWKSSPEMFDARLLAGRIQSGERVEEIVEDSTAQSSS